VPCEGESYEDCLDEEQARGQPHEALSVVLGDTGHAYRLPDRERLCDRQIGGYGGSF
jgi:hypothetical protein